MPQYSMNAIDLKVGGIYQTTWDASPWRVIGFDAMEVFYDCLWSHNQQWSFASNLKKKCFFYRMSSSLFSGNSHLLEILEISPEERNVFQPNLPLRLGRIKSFQWSSFPYESFGQFLEDANGIHDWALETVECARLVLIPSGPKGGLKKGVVVEARNGQAFSATELIWKAYQIQDGVNCSENGGIGIYRLGFQHGLPSYYIGEYYDQAGILKE